jgi:hypothetical protein
MAGHAAAQVAIMIILIAILLGVVLLYFWLIGHWFARVLVTPLLWATLWFVLTMFGAGGSIGGNTSPMISLVSAVAAVVVGWIVASLPTWHKRRRLANP